MKPAERILQVVVDQRTSGIGMSQTALPPELEVVDAYDLFDQDLDAVAGISIAAGCDQVFLQRNHERLESFVRGGGRMVFSGHVTLPFVEGMRPWRKIVYTGPKDLAITSLAPHPIWRGVDVADLLYRTGVPGDHSPEEMARVGVAGFYGRGYHVRLPEGAVVINGIGPLLAPIDYEYPLGEGRVVVHGGLDLFAMVDPRRSTAVLGANVARWLKGDDQ